jgi:hypothetical protein
MRSKRSLAVLAAALSIGTALAIAPSAWATVSGTATLAPIGTGSYLLTVTNTGDEAVGAVGLPGNESTKNAVSSSGQCIPFVGSLLCTVELPPAKSAQICYSGTTVTEVVFSTLLTHVPVTSAPAASSCPLPGFTPASTGTPVPAPGGGGGSAAAGAFSLGKAKDNAGKGTATLVANTPGPGTLGLSGKGVKSATANPKAAGLVTLTVKATGKAASKLAKTGKVKVKVSVTFTPAGGSPSTQAKTVKLVKRLAK